MVSKKKVTEADLFEAKISSLWWAMLLRGLIFLLLGVMLFANPISTANIMIFAFGIYLFIDGIVTFIMSIVKHKQIQHWWVLTIQGVLAFIVGLFALSSPLGFSLTTASVIFFMIGFGLFIVGLIQFVATFIQKSWSMLFASIITISLGVLFFSSKLISSVFMIYLIALLLVIGGLISIGVSFFLEKDYRDSKTSLSKKERKSNFWWGLITTLLVLTLLGLVVYGMFFAPTPAEQLEKAVKCDMPPEVGPGRAYFHKYFFNPQSGDCEEFVYGGLGPYPFDTMEECKDLCE